MPSTYLQLYQHRTEHTECSYTPHTCAIGESSGTEGSEGWERRRNKREVEGWERRR